MGLPALIFNLQLQGARRIAWGRFLRKGRGKEGVGHVAGSLGPLKVLTGFSPGQGSGSSLVLQLPRCGPIREEMSEDEVRTVEDRGWGGLPRLSR